MTRYTAFGPPDGLLSRLLPPTKGSESLVGPTVVVGEGHGVAEALAHWQVARDRVAALILLDPTDTVEAASLPALPAINVPTLLLLPNTVPPHAALTLQAAIPGSRLVTVPDGEPDRTAVARAALEEFLEVTGLPH